MMQVAEDMMDSRMELFSLWITFAPHWPGFSAPPTGIGM